MIQKIISGGQTGADRAGIDAAIESGIDYGGWLPKGRKAEDGVVPETYNQSTAESWENRKTGHGL